MISIILSCCSGVILLSEGKHNPLRKISAPTSIPEPFIYAFVRPLPLPSTVTNGFVLYIGCICIGFHIAHVSVGEEKTSLADPQTNRRLIACHRLGLDPSRWFFYAAFSKSTTVTSWINCFTRSVISSIFWATSPV